MNMHAITFDKDWPETLGNTRLGIIRARLDCRESDAALWQKIDTEIKQTREKYQLEELNKIPVIAETRHAYKLAGNDPNRYRPSANALMRRIVKGQELYRINNVVDSLNLVSIQSGFSIGGYDESQIRGRVSLGLGRKDEAYSGIGRGALNITNLPVLRDEAGAFGSPTSDSARTMISEKSESIAFVFFDFGRSNFLPDALNQMQELLLKHCDASEMTSLTIEVN